LPSYPGLWVNFIQNNYLYDLLFEIQDNYIVEKRIDGTTKKIASIADPNCFDVVIRWIKENGIV